MNTETALKLKPDELTRFVLKNLETRPLSKTSLCEFKKAPRYYIEYLLGERKEKEAWLLGKIVECYLLECRYDFDHEKWEKESFDRKFIVADKPDLRVKENKIKWELLLAEAQSKNLVLIPGSMDLQAQMMAINTLTNPNCKFWIDKKQGLQKKISWTDKATELPIIGFIDFETEINEHKTIIDNKQSKCADPEEFYKDVYKLGYDVQIGSYLTGYHKMYYEFPDFMFMVSTNIMPFDSYMVYCPPDLCNKAKEDFNNLLIAFKYCIDNNQFHLGTDFWLFQDTTYHILKRPGYIKSKILSD